MKKVMLTIFVILNVNTLYSDDVLKDAVYNGNLLPLDTQITPQKLMDFSLFELQILRNMIYAKYNYRFRSNDLYGYFSQFSWYSGTENDVERLLTYIDHRNVKIIKTLEEHYPVVIPYNDERINDFLFLTESDTELYWQSGVHGKYRNQSAIGNFLVIMGWTGDGKLCCFGTSRIHNSFENINREMFDKIIERAERELNIIPVSDIIPTNIEGYSIYLKPMLRQQDPRYGITYYYEIGLKNDLNNDTIRLGDYYDNGAYDYHRLSENDFYYLCLKNPFEENILSLIVIVEEWQGGDKWEGWYTFHDIYRIDLNELYE
jgi:hypothetical protein